MDEEQGLQSPIAGGIRGIRRSVSSSIFTGRAVPPPAPDPQTTSLLNQNSLSLTCKLFFIASNELLILETCCVIPESCPETVSNVSEFFDIKF